ncbi:MULTISPECIES: Flp pilus assembly protein CpaB [unclassified Pannonibacter]|uniref:Flp pilus assembly protein CpaB n=1 Tax=unclassified Pannonibacter TaxID=2627228 RepID=UPI001645E714|nr:MULTISPECIES: Flp pilus assembly protein CpaB [unclassified Pannonibacter]
MKHARLLVLGIAIGAGLLAARMVMSSRAPEQPAPVQAEAAAQPTVPVLIVTRDVKPGELVYSHDLKWVDWPRDVVPAGAVTRDQQPDAERSMAGQVAKAPLYNGEPLREQRLITAASGYMASVLPKGMRAIAVSVETETMAGGFILPGNKVDVILTRTVQGSVTSAVAETILQNVRVLAIDAVIAGEREGKSLQPDRTATLELSPEQAEVVAQAQQLGKISLTLRSAEDSADDAADSASRRDRGSVNFVRYGVSSNGAGQ